MSKYLNADEILEAIDRIFNYCEEIDCHLPKEEQTGYKMYPDITVIKEFIRNIPEIVRCKECKYYKYNKYYQTYCCCRKPKKFIDEYDKRNLDDYCSKGKRRENNG